MPDLLDWLLANESSFRKSRLPSLYSDLSVQKSTNPEGFLANATTWQTALTAAAIAGQLSTEQRLAIQTSDELLSALACPQYGRPSGLGLVFDEGVKSGKIYDTKEFKNAKQSIYSNTWIPSPWTILHWSLKQAGLTWGDSYDRSGMLRSGTVVLVAALEEVYKNIVAKQVKAGSTLTDRVMTRETFNTNLARLNDEPLSSQDVDLLLLYLARDKQILTYDAETIKFKAASSDTPEPITAEDKSIANLKTLIDSLESQVSKLNVRIANLQKDAKSAVESKNKTYALSVLRSKKVAEKTLQQRADMLSQLEEVYSSIGQAVDHVQMVEVMQSSASVLKGLNKKIGSVERVEDVMDELKDEMSKVGEVGQVLQEPLGDQAVLDEVEVENELEEMEQEEKRKEDEKAAEITRKRLSELQANHQKEVEASKAETELTLNDSIERLNKMTIDSDGRDEAIKETRPQAIQET